MQSDSSDTETSTLTASENGDDQRDQTAVIAGILSSSEKLEADSGPSGYGKKSRKKRTAEDTQDPQLWKVINHLQKELTSLKRKTTDHEVSLASPANARSPKRARQLSPAKSKQLSPAKNQQLRSANNQQLSSATATRRQSPEEQQLSPVQDIALEEESSDEEDSLRRELHEQQSFMATQAGTQQQQQQQESEHESESEQEQADDTQFFEDMVSAIDIRGDEDIPGAALIQSWADKLNLAWKTKVGKETLANMLKKYRTPENLKDFQVPKMNKEIWRLCDKFQRKVDLSLAQSQRCLIKAATATLKLNEHFSVLPNSTRQLAMQTTADIVSLLGQVNREVISRRKVMTRPNLKGDFKYLSTNTTNTTENLFGDNLTQDIKDIQTKRKIENHGYGSFTRGYNNNRGGGRRNRNYGGNYGNFLYNTRGQDRYNNNNSRASHHHNNKDSRGRGYKK